MSTEIEISVEQGNRLIAEFMGAEWVQDDYGDWGYKSKYFPTHYKYWAASSLKYSSSWDWLMSAVEKIEALTTEYGRGEVNFIVSIESDYCVISVGGEEIIVDGQAFDTDPSKIEMVFGCVVKFIQWYNNQSKQDVVKAQ